MPASSVQSSFLRTQTLPAVKELPLPTTDHLHRRLLPLRFSSLFGKQLLVRDEGKRLKRGTEGRSMFLDVVCVGWGAGKPRSVPPSSCRSAGPRLESEEHRLGTDGLRPAPEAVRQLLLLGPGVALGQRDPGSLLPPDHHANGGEGGRRRAEPAAR